MTQPITTEQWEAWRQQLRATCREGTLALVIYNPQTNQRIDMHLPANFAELPVKLQVDAYLIPAMQQLGYVKPD